MGPNTRELGGYLAAFLEDHRAPIALRRHREHVGIWCDFFLIYRMRSYRVCCWVCLLWLELEAVRTWE